MVPLLPASIGLAGGGGVSKDTDLNKIIIAAFLDAHNNLVSQLRVSPINNVACFPNQ